MVRTCPTGPATITAVQCWPGQPPDTAAPRRQSSLPFPLPWLGFCQILTQLSFCASVANQLRRLFESFDLLAGAGGHSQCLFRLSGRVGQMFVVVIVAESPQLWGTVNWETHMSQFTQFPRILSVRQEQENRSDLPAIVFSPFALFCPSGLLTCNTSHAPTRRWLSTLRGDSTIAVTVVNG